MTRFDPVGALCETNAVSLNGSGDGPLTGLGFVAKDVFDIAGVGTGFGHPAWLATHDVPATTAVAVQQLLDAGAKLIGKAHSDELCYSLTGENIHYGSPVNVAAPGRITGGSSNGSAAAVAAGMCDFALGTDCGGSVRIPASYCGLLGLRPSWGAVPTAGVLDFAPSFDVVGWFARDGRVMRQVGEALLPQSAQSPSFDKLLIASDAFTGAGAALKGAFSSALNQIASEFNEAADAVVSEEGLAAWAETFRVMQGFEVWRSVAAWVQSVKPSLGPGVSERLKWASTVTPEMYAAALAERSHIVRRLDDLLPPGTALCLPTSPRGAPLRNMPTDTIEVEYRNQALRILCIAGLGGLPQISLPLMTSDSLPVGLSIVGWRGADRELLALAEKLCPPA